MTMATSTSATLHVCVKVQDVEASEEDRVLSLIKPDSEYAARKLRELKQQTIDTGVYNEAFLYITSWFS